MGKIAKIGISLPEELLAAAERERAATGESRSEFFRSAVEERLRRKRQREDEARYVRGYMEQPETPDEDLSAASAQAWAELPWE